MTDDLLTRLADLDPAPRTGLDGADLDRREQLLRTVLAEPAAPQPPVATGFLRRPLVRRTAFALTGGLAAAAVAVTLLVTAAPSDDTDAGALSPAGVASWTPSASALDTSGDAAALPPLHRCLVDTKRVTGDFGAGVIGNADRRGDTASMTITRRGTSAYCVASWDGTGTVVPLGPLTPVAEESAVLDTLGNNGTGAARFTYGAGSAGSGVKALTLRSGDRTVEATIGWSPTLPYARWTAWWPGGDTSAPLTLTLTLADGTTRTVDVDRPKRGTGPDGDR